MGRPKVWPPVPRLHKASGLEYVRVNGKPIYLGKPGSPEAKKAYADLLTQIAAKPGEPVVQPKKTRKDGLTVAEMVEKWQDYAESRYSEEGREAAQFSYATAVLLSVCPALLVSRFDLAQLDRCRDEMIRLDWCRGVINARVLRLRTVFRWAEQKGHAPPGTWAALRALAPLAKGDQRVREALQRKPAEWKNVARVCRQLKPLTRDMLLVCWFTGMRPGEVRVMTVGEIDRTSEEWVYRPGKHKCGWRGHSRAVVLGPKARRVLEKHLEGKNTRDLVFPSSEAGKPYRMDSFARAVHRAKVRAGVEGEVIPYGCRHAAKQRITRECGLDAARAALGQSSIQTTNEYAAGQDLELARKVARKLG